MPDFEDSVETSGGTFEATAEEAATEFTDVEEGGTVIVIPPVGFGEGGFGEGPFGGSGETVVIGPGTTEWTNIDTP
jgi:hypothetical protein